MKHPSASAGNSPRCGARKAGGFQESGLGPATAQSAGAVATSSGNAGRRVTSSPPYTTAGPLGSDPYSQLTSRPEAGRRKPRLSRPAHRPASAPSGPEEVEGPVSGCAIAERVPGPGLRGLAGAGRTGEGGARLPGERQVRPRRACGGAPSRLWQGARDRRLLPGRRGQRRRRGWTQFPGGNPDPCRPSAPDVSRETAPCPAGTRPLMAGPGG